MAAEVSVSPPPRTAARTASGRDSALAAKAHTAQATDAAASPDTPPLCGPLRGSRAAQASALASGESASHEPAAAMADVTRSPPLTAAAPARAASTKSAEIRRPRGARKQCATPAATAADAAAASGCACIGRHDSAAAAASASIVASASARPTGATRIAPPLDGDGPPAVRHVPGPPALSRCTASRVVRPG